MSETIDSLLVSLGLETDAKSFQKANDAVKGIKDGILQLAAAAGTGIGLKALTTDLSASVLEMDRLSKITNFTVKQIDGLRYAMRSLGLSPDAANQIVQKIPDLQQRATQGELGDKAYWNGLFNPAEFALKTGMDSLTYLINAYEKMNNDQRRNLRNGISAGDNDPFTRLLEGGIKKFNTSLKNFEALYKPLDPKLIDSANAFNKEMATLATNFENLARLMGRDLLPIINALLGSINQFINENPEVSKAILTAAGVVGTAGALKFVGGILPRAGGKPPVSVAGERGWTSRLLFNPVTIGVTAALTPGNIFTSADDAKAMSNPDSLKRQNWAKNNPDIPYLDDTDGLNRPANYPNVRQYPEVLANTGETANYSPLLYDTRDDTQQLNQFTPAANNPNSPEIFYQKGNNNLSHLVDHTNVRQYLDMLAKAEGTAGYANSGYNTLFGGDQFYDISDHPRKLIEFKQPDGTPNKTSAAGRYQFTRDSWDDAAKALNLTDFSPRSQDIAALFLIQRAGQLENVVNGNFADATGELGGVWASLPSSNYAQPKRSWEDIQGYSDRQITPVQPMAASSPRGDVRLEQYNTISVGTVGGDADSIRNGILQATTQLAQQARDLMYTEHY
ncbi:MULTISPECIES: glycoside hydrolase family 24 protein [Yersinia pseudotuberculosis complex]|nr:MULTISPECIES: glycoside hydrolase family 104 protein [Yersinia pseudotuberculosis complex]AJK15448.1 phage lysozyme family protein [Yersinia pseudotuberculosis str. PA3606]MCE4114767.1 glycoside hydrolase family 104 protein [Yersinia pseudotuberculosis]MCF1165378.1 glycoside hydrolase family 104 protein [Yersinia pseudotuberculosis]UFA61879.1 Phage lysozyme [Yersinia pseudotuberculosis]WLF02188.1 glycoside hydrolase family 104 protein [Yersinia pseudotuberculosis]